MDAVHLLETLLPIDSTAGKEEKLANQLTPYLRALGYELRKQAVPGGRVNLWATRGEPSLIFCTHLDTVPPHLPTRREGDTLWGRGANDAKGQIVTMIAAAEEIVRSLPHAPALLLVSGEELDHQGAIEAAKLGLPKVPIVIGEPTCSQLASGGKGLLKMRVDVEGRAAHSAFPEMGISAIDHLLDALQRLRQSELPEDSRFGQTTLNIGRIQGGVADNVVPARASAELFFRCSVPAAEIEALAAGALEGPGCSWQRTTHCDPIPFETLPGFSTDVVPFGTDGPFLPPGHPLMMIGPGDIRLAHAPDERITVAELKRGIADLVRLARAISP